MAALMSKLGLEKSDTGLFVILRRNRGGLLKRPRDGGIEITAKGRADWIGSPELRSEPIRETPMRNTARVMIDIAADYDDRANLSDCPAEPGDRGGGQAGAAVPEQCRKPVPQVQIE